MTTTHAHYDLGYGVTCEWQNDWGLAIYTVPDVQPATIDAYINGLLDTAENWFADKPLRTLHDLSSSKIFLTGYARKRLLDVADRSRHMTVYRAILVHDPFMESVMNRFIQFQLKRRTNGISRVFHDYDDAMQWLNNQP